MVVRKNSAVACIAKKRRMTAEGGGRPAARPNHLEFLLFLVPPLKSRFFPFRASAPLNKVLDLS
jgi:hypothetical protein